MNNEPIPDTGPNTDRERRETRHKDRVASLQFQITAIARHLSFLEEHREFFLSCDIDCGSYGGGYTLDFDNLDHPDVIKVVQHFGGKWSKSYRDGVVDYTQTLANGIKLRCWGGKPPPNCKLVEYEEDVPEQVIPAKKVKKFRLQCVESVTPQSITEAPAAPQDPQGDGIPF